MAEPVAITFDDLPLNGEPAPGMTRVGVVAQVMPILKRFGLQHVYGFVNAKKLEGSEDGAAALRAWIAGGQSVGNHTYAHLDLNKASPDDFLGEVRTDEPVLELLDANGAWRWLRYPYLREGDTVEKRRQVRATLKERGYRIAQVTLDFEDYLWNTPYARCLAAHDEQASVPARQSPDGRGSLRTSYQPRPAAAPWRVQFGDPARSVRSAEKGRIRVRVARAGAGGCRLRHRSRRGFEVRRHAAGAVDGRAALEVSRAAEKTLQAARGDLSSAGVLTPRRASRIDA
jgi:peptidoglycan/xylan/chitin deacetylase (PgdA/CDA1 family)